MREKADYHLSEQLQGDVMTLAQQLEQVGMAKGVQQGESTVLLRQLVRKFDVVPDNYRQKILSANAEQLLHWCDRVLDANSLVEVFH